MGNDYCVILIPISMHKVRKEIVLPLHVKYLI
ncbi:hypothetical protein GGQ57_001840 [Parabacteroides faecis]|jgi:hypothetical protein|uniref:AraC family transcriptional regulator n=1 Tax=Parabacteroides faecis TaxID=1217282 RepID=A0ABR6KMA1_9BACT|nr:hypothetical protein [Parabacteroides faecis]